MIKLIYVDFRDRMWLSCYFRLFYTNDMAMEPSSNQSVNQSTYQNSHVHDHNSWQLITFKWQKYTIWYDQYLLRQYDRTED